jgi:hypothetical protein
MSKYIESTGPHALGTLLTQVETQEMALPDFQRDFVWDPWATQELIVSLAQDNPAGSLLRIRNTKDYFSARAVQGAPELSGRPTYLLLDGQQRMTSLYQAFFGKGDYRYFLNIRDLIEEDSFEEAMFHVRANAKKGQQALQLKKYSTREGQFEDRVFPMEVLFGTPKGFTQWQRDLEDMEPDAVRKQELRDMLDKVYKQYIQRIELYQFPIVQLSDATPPDAVCSIFETLNRTGVKLGVFDLLTARFWAHDVKLRELWASAKDTSDLMEDFFVDPYYLLQATCLLRSGAAPSCKRKDVLALDAKHVEDKWESVSKAMVEALHMLRHDCGVLTWKWVPYYTMLIPMAAVLAEHQGATGMKVGEIRHKLLRWYWCSVYSQSFEKAPNSRAAKDFVALRAWLNGGPEPESVNQFSFDKHTLFDITPQQRALYQGTIALILSGGPKDFLRSERIDVKVIESDHIDDHHIFPDDFLKTKLKITEKKKRDCVLNRTLIDRTSNRQLRARGPKDYFGALLKERGANKYGEIMRTHKLPPEATSSILSNDYEGFLDYRADELLKLIKKATAA